MAFLSFTRDLDPIQALLDLQQELDRFSSRSPSWDLGPSGGGVFPPVNVFSDGDGILVRAEVPGVKPEGLGIQIEGRTLTVSGERTHNDREKRSYHRRERRFGRFSRSIQLPDDLDGAKANADCRHGVLTIRIPKRPEARPRRIEVRTS